MPVTDPGADNIIAALEQSNRVWEVSLYILAGWQLEKVLAAMQVPFPELAEISMQFSISSYDLLSVPPIPDSFMGGSAPRRLQFFKLFGIPFPGLPKLLMSATHLVYLLLSDIPDSGYFSPEAMVALLSVLSSLESFTLRFRSPLSCPERESTCVPPPKRSILPALTTFNFRGVTEYLEKLVTSIDAPQLDFMSIYFFHQINFVIPRLAQFINRTPTLGAGNKARVEIDDSSSRVAINTRGQTLGIQILCRTPYQELSTVTQVCNSSLHRLSMVEDLYIHHRYMKLVRKNNATENILWLQLLLPFTAVKNLYLSRESAPDIGAALQELVGARITEVLPSLRNIFVEGLKPSGRFRENIGQFIAARQLRVSDHPIAILPGTTTSTWS